MTKAELIERIHRRKALPPDLTKKVIGQVVDAVFEELREYFLKSKFSRPVPRFTYPGFGTFAKRRRGARLGRNPRTGEAVRIPPAVTVAFAPGQELKALLNGNGAAARKKP